MSNPIFPLAESENTEIEGQMIMPEFEDKAVESEEKAVAETVNTDNDSHTNQTQDDVTDIDISVTAKKRFRFDKDNNRVVALNTSDVGIIARISEAYPKLQELQSKAATIMDGVDFNEDESDDTVVTASMKKVANRLKKVDGEMRQLIDYIFDSDVSSKAAPSGSMYDPFEGSFRFEYILTVLINQYEQNLTREFSKMERQLKSHTDKYTKG